jgi:hypothetical protein
MSEEMTIAESQQADQQVEEIANPAEATAANEDQGNQEQEEQTKEERKFSQDELDKIVQKRLAKERRNIEKYAHAEAENRILRERLAPQREAAPDVGDGKPSPAQFNDYESYVEALSDWKVEQKLVSLQQQRMEQRAEQERAAQAETVRQKLSGAADKYDDFEEVALNPKVPISTAMAQAIAESDISGDLAYYLGSHIDEAKRIAGLTPVGQVRELAKLEGKLMTEPVAQSKAPKPISTVTGRKSSSNALADDLPMDEWLKRRHTEIKNRYR